MADTYTDVPYIYPEPGSTRHRFLRDFFYSAVDTPRNIGLLGDSQETTNAQGVTYVGWLNLLFRRMYGKAGLSSYAITGPWGGSAFDVWTVLHTSTVDVDTGDFPANKVPPLQSQPKLIKHDGGAGTGWWLHISHDGTTVSSLAKIGGATLFPKSDAWYLKVVALTQDGSEQIRVNCKTTTSRFATTTGTVATATFDTTFEIDSTDEWQFVSQEVGPLVWDDIDADYMQVQLTAANTSGVKPAVMSCQLVNRDPDQYGGVAVTSFSAGGYVVNDFLTTHGDCWDTLAAMGMEAFIIKLSANDLTSGSLVTYKTNLSTMIDNLRTAVPNCPIVLISDGYVIGAASQFDEASGVHKELCDEYDRIVLINGRRILEDCGHKAANESATADDPDWIGAWATSTSYAVDDLVYINGASHSSLVWECIKAHTSSAANKPGIDSNNSAVNWQERRRFLYNGDGNFTDTVHLTGYGGRMSAMMDVMAMLNGVNITSNA